MILSCVKDEVLSKTFMKSEQVYIGDFFEKLSNTPTSNYDFAFIHTPILYKEKSNYILINSSDYILMEDLERLKINGKTFVLKIEKTNLTINELISVFNLLSLVYLPKNKRDDAILREIFLQNPVLNTLCPYKTNQIGYINKNFCNNDIASQKLAKLNRKIDFKESTKFLKEREIYYKDLNEIVEITEKIRKYNKKMHLIDLLQAISEAKIKKIEDLKFILKYLCDKNHLYHHNLIKITNFISFHSKINYSTIDIPLLISHLDKSDSEK